MISIYIQLLWVVGHVCCLLYCFSVTELISTRASFRPL